MQTKREKDLIENLSSAVKQIKSLEEQNTKLSLQIKKLKEEIESYKKVVTAEEKKDPLIRDFIKDLYNRKNDYYQTKLIVNGIPIEMDTDDIKQRYRYMKEIIDFIHFMEELS